MPDQEGFTTGSENMLVALLVELSLSTFLPYSLVRCL